MNENPYSSMLDIVYGAARDCQSPTIQIGTVITSPPNLTISYNGMTLNSDELYISEYLLPDYTRHVKGETSYRGGGSGDPAYESHNHPIDNDETWTDTLVYGDKVAMMPCQSENGTKQQYIVLDKIVRPDRRTF